ncbi:MAG: ATP-dependent Clp protease proteolytic subunit [Bdellovibrionaceae bacterium]|nr:ATP-dependent Clp protease proteolytic subunit [Pseudobdellovibrionaceae bacterium]MDW8189456.1 NfeD family protein [Pseudobdellovibrionaceae bacterium]
MILSRFHFLTYLLTLCFNLNAFAEKAWQLDLKGTINPGSADYIISNLKLANQSQVSAYILRLNTPGGLLSSTRDIVQAFNESNIPVIVVIAPGGASATSAGALVSLAADVVIMVTGTNIGAAHPVMPGGENPKGPVNDKAVQDTAAMARAQALKHGRNVELAEKIVSESLSFTAEEALRKNLIDAVIPDEGKLIETINQIKWDKKNKKIEKPIVHINPVEMTLKQKFLNGIADPNISVMLLSLAGLAIYTEISSGFTLVAPGILGLILFILGAVSLQMLPINVGGLSLLLLGLAMLILELFVTSYGLLAIGGLASIFVGSLFLVDSFQLSEGVSANMLGPIFLAMILVVAFFGWVIYRDSRKKASFGMEALQGCQAKVLSLDTDTSGTIEINGEIWNFRSTVPVQKGQKVTVLRFEKDHLEVIP